MLDQLLSGLKEQALPDLINKFGLNDQQAEGSVKAAADSVQEAIAGGNGFGLDDVTNLFSSASNTAGADKLLSTIGGLLKSKLTSQVGIGADKAGGITDMLLPLITQLMAKDGKGLQGLLGQLGGGDLGNVAKGLVGKLFK
jgi:hypothetical protein